IRRAPGQPELLEGIVDEGGHDSALAGEMRPDLSVRPRGSAVEAVAHGHSCSVGMAEPLDQVDEGPSNFASERDLLDGLLPAGEQVGDGLPSLPKREVQARGSKAELERS